MTNSRPKKVDTAAALPTAPILFRGSELQLRHQPHCAIGLQPLRNLTASLSSLKRAIFLSLFVALMIAPLGTTPVAAQSQRAKEIGMHLKCLCKGCDMSAGGCAHPGGAFSGPCDTAKSELKEVDDRLAKGQSEQEIIDAFVREYGTIAYMEPPKHGFGLVAWLMPVIYTILGLAAVIFVVRKWSSHNSGTASHLPAAPGVSQEALQRARAQASRDTEDY